MAASGTINLSVTSTNDVTGKITWSESNISVANNTSDVTVSLTYSKPSTGYETYGSASDRNFYITINGTTYNDPKTSAFSLPAGGGSVTVITKTVTITHDSNGSKSITISGGGYLAGTTGLSASSGSGTATLTNIARASQIGTVSNFNIEDAFSVPVTKYDSSFTDTLTIKIGSTTIKTISGYTNNASIALTVAEILAAYNAISSANTSATFTFSMTTKSGSTTIGSSTDKTATGTIAGTSKIKVSGSWKRCVPWVKVSGSWKRTVAHAKASGTWKRCTG